MYTRWITIWRTNKRKKEAGELNPTEDHRKSRVKWSRNRPTGQEMTEAKIIAMKEMQQQCFKKELETLQEGEKVKFGKCATFQLYLDDQGLIRCHSRVKHRILQGFSISPVLVDTEHCFVKEYLKSMHKCHNHAQTNSTLNKVRQVVHGPGIKNAVKKIVSTCSNCRRIRASPYSYPMQPNLPIERYLMES